MKELCIIGAGMGAGTLTAEAMERIDAAGLLIASTPRLLTALNKTGQIAYKPADVRALIENSACRRIAVLVSGDVGFYSAASPLYSELIDLCPILIPGISSLQYFFARCALPYQDARVVSCHGTDADIVSPVRRNRLTFALTGGNVSSLAASLCQAGFGELTARAGMELGRADERFLTLRVAELQELELSPLCVLLIENPAYDTRCRIGIPDDAFLRASVPMTKSEARAVALSKLALCDSAVCYDIGCGTGSVTVEAALCAHKGRVFSIDKDPVALSLTKENCRRFHIGNVTLIDGEAPDAFAALPPPDAAFIGGSGGALCSILRALIKKNPRVRLVQNSVTLESALCALTALEQAGLSPELEQLQAARAKGVGGLHMLSAQNPIFIVSGGGACKDF